MEKENKEKNNKLVIILLIVIIAILLLLVVLLTTGTISFKSNTIDNNSQTNENNNEDIKENNKSNNTNNDAIDEKNNNNQISDKVDIELSMNTASVTKEGPNARIHIKGTIKLSYDNNKYAGVTLSGYCLGADNEKYLISGPGDGRALFHNDENNKLLLTENIPQSIQYSDGTSKEWSEIDWDNVKIKYCKIEKMTAWSNDGTNNYETTLNIEKEF